MARTSVIIPYFNRLAYIGYAVESALGQDDCDIEVVIVDDGSAVSLDKQRETIRPLRDPRVTIIRQANSGCGAARNTALDAASGDFVLFLDSDDYLEPGALGQLTRILDES